MDRPHCIDEILNGLDGSHLAITTEAKITEWHAYTEWLEAKVTGLTEAMKIAEGDGFKRGYVIACCNLFNLHNEDSLAYDVLNELGVTRTEVKAMDLCEYDAKALRRVEKGRVGSPYADGRKVRRTRTALATKEEDR